MGTQRDDPSSRLPSPVFDSPRPVIKSLLLAPCTLLPALRRYFSSGWAFLIPYLVAYLLYWWLRWPVNAVAGEGAVKVASGSASLTSSLPHSPVPPLLYVYWALHAINLILAAIALVSWWRERRARVTDESRNGTPLAHGFPAPFSLPLAPSPAAKPRDEPSQSSEGAKAGRPSLPQSLTPSPPAPSLSRSLSLRIAPWFLLALVFWIPGFYIEWPSDPWEHLRRINEWATHDVAGEFSAGYKSFYFFAYSFVGRIPTGHEFVWLNVYYTGMCLLLSWHYYRLARATGLESRWAFLFVIVSALTFGNVTFSFFRYYGLASTTFAQIGAVALIRIAIEALKAPEQGARGKEQGAQDPGLRPKAPMSALRRCLLLLVPCSLLLLLVVFSHIQGIGIAGLGIGAVIVWRLIAWRRSMVWWLAVATILLIGTFLYRAALGANRAKK